jgi:hypothetical protein
MGVYPFIAVRRFVNRQSPVSPDDGLAVNLTEAQAVVYDTAHMVIPVIHAL